MSNHYTLSLVTYFKKGLDMDDQATLKYLLMRSESAPASWPKHHFFEDGPSPLHLGYESFAHGDFLCELWCDEHGSPVGANIRIPSLADHSFFNYLLLADWLAKLSLPVGFIGTGTNEYRTSETMLLYVVEGTLYVNESQPRQLKGFSNGASIAIGDHL
jgi:hypothetical protein